MSNIQLCGDIHGSFDSLQRIINSFKGLTIVLGDVGIGFVHQYVNPLFYLDKDAPYKLTTLTNFEVNREQLVWIRGNHDNPDMCRKHHNYLGEYGVFQGIFYISGAWSIDRDYRKEGVDWWADEELTMEQCYDALDLYKQTKPRIVISHDCPKRVLSLIYHSNAIETRTGQLLDSMFEQWKPKQWIFAHHHLSFKASVQGTEFRCLDCHETYSIGV